MDVVRTPEGPADVRVLVRYTGSPGSPDGDPGPSWPSDLVVINLPQATVEWEVEGDPDAHVFRVLGPVRPIVAESRWIKLFEPAPGARVGSPFSLSGLANVFEGTVNYRLMAGRPDGAGSAGDHDLTGRATALGGDAALLIAEGFSTGAMGAWGPFSAEVAYVLPAGVIGTGSAGAAPGFLEVFSISPRDGSEVDKIVVPLELETLGAVGADEVVTFYDNGVIREASVREFVTLVAGIASREATGLGPGWEMRPGYAAYVFTLSLLGVEEPWAFGSWQTTMAGEGLNVSLPDGTYLGTYVGAFRPDFESERATVTLKTAEEKAHLITLTRAWPGGPWLVAEVTESDYVGPP